MRAFFVNEICMVFLLNSQAQGVSSKNEQSTQTPWRGASEARGPMQLHELHRFKAGSGDSHFFEALMWMFSHSSIELSSIRICLTTTNVRS